MTRPGVNPRDDRHWKLVCGVDGCDVEWAATIKLTAVQLHFEMSHPDWTEPIAFNTEWIGPGAAPAEPDNRAARRREERRVRRRRD